MKGERGENNIAIYLTADEVYRLQDGHTIGDRLGVTSADSKVEVLPLGALKEDDSLADKWSLNRLEIAKGAALHGILSTDADLQIFVPKIALSDVRVTTAKLPREQISTPGTEDTSYLHRSIPDEGVVVFFGGSLTTVDVQSELYREELI